MEGGDESSIERLRKRLYSRSKEKLGTFKRRSLSEHQHGIQDAWPESSQPMARTTQKKSILSTLLIISVFFFVLSLGAAAFFFFGGSTTVSSRNIDIEIQGPATVGGGEELVLQIAITNRNATPIQSADLLVEYPEGTRTATDLSAALPRHRESVGAIKPGERIEKTVRATPFGEEGSTQTISATLEYRVPDSNAIFFKEQIYEFILSTAPLTVSIEAIEELSSGQETTFTLIVASNSDEVIHDVLLEAEYPFGFEFVSSQPNPAFTNTTWSLGDIEPEGQRTVTIRGKVLGEDGDERVFRFAAGIRSEVDETQLEAAFITAVHTIAIEKPFLDVVLALDGSTQSEFVAQSGRRIRADISWFNNLPTQIFDGEIEVRLQGSALDERSVEVKDGFYRSSDDTIVWTRETNQSLAAISENGGGSVSFSFAPFALSERQTLQNPEITLELSVRGRRVSERNVPETIESTSVRTVRIASDLLLSARAVYFTGPFTNTGPIPPRADQETSYTILWTVTNSHNTVSDAAITAVLPSYVRFMGVVSPSGERVTFNDLGGRITWNAGSLEPGEKKDVAFQVALLPSLSQVGRAPILVEEQRVRGLDRFTNTEVGSTHPALTTQLSTDPQFDAGGDRVVE
jgi:hypothetical protein